MTLDDIDLSIKNIVFVNIYERTVAILEFLYKILSI